MPATWFIGDPHFFHEKTAFIRGFETVEAQNNFIVNKWLKVVNADDRVIVMGDCSGGNREQERKALELIQSLPGEKELICGNHDSTSSVQKTPSPNRRLFNETFNRVSEYGRVRHYGKEILLSHYPYWASQDGPGRGPGRYEQFRLPDLGKLLIHAHTHHNHPTNGSATGREICVSWDAWGRMVNMGDIAQLIKKMEL